MNGTNQRQQNKARFSDVIFFYDFSCKINIENNKMLLIYYYFMCTFDISFGWHSPAKAWRCRVFVAVVLFRPVFGLLLLFDKPHQPASNQACCDSRSDHSIAKLKIKTESSDKSGTAKKKNVILFSEVSIWPSDRNVLSWWMEMAWKCFGVELRIAIHLAKIY